MIVCEMCKKEYKSVNNMHLRSHKMTLEEYAILYPGAATYSMESIGRSAKTRRENYSSGKEIHWSKIKNESEVKEIYKKNSDNYRVNYSIGKIKSWNKGKNKETSDAVKVNSENISKSLKFKYANGEIRHSQLGLTGDLCHSFGVSIKDKWIKLYGELQAKKMWEEHCKKHLLKITKNTKNCERLKNVLLAMGYEIVEEFGIFDEETKKHRFYDIFVPTLNMLFESDGTYYHVKDFWENKRSIEELTEFEKKQVDNDKCKNNIAKKYGYSLVRVWANEENVVWRKIC